MNDKIASLTAADIYLLAVEFRDSAVGVFLADLEDDDAGGCGGPQAL